MSRFILSLRKNSRGILFILVSALALSVGQLLWKISPAAPNALFILGFIVYGVGALFMIMAYRHSSLSVVQPMMSVGYVCALAIGGLVLGESIGASMVAGLGLIIIGNLLIGGGDH